MYKKKVLLGSLKPFGVDIGGLSEDTIVERKAINPTVKIFEGEEKTVVATISNQTVDADGDILVASGCDLSRYVKNPICCWSHDYSIPGMAKTTEIQIVNKNVVNKMKFGSTAFANDIFTLVSEGIIKACSVGFITLEALASGSKECKAFCKDAGIELSKNCKRVITKWILLENSFVNIGSNPDAGIEQVSVKNYKLDGFTKKKLGLEEVEVKEVPDQSLTEKPQEPVQLSLDTITTLMSNYGLVKLNEWLKQHNFSEITELITEARGEVGDHANPAPVVGIVAVPNPLPAGSSNGDDGAVANINPTGPVDNINAVVADPVLELVSNREPMIEPALPPKPSYVVIRNGSTEISVELQKQLINDVKKEIEDNYRQLELDRIAREQVKKGKIL